MVKLSIITINLDNKSGLIKTINSVISQSFTNFEFIVIDGGSKDGSLEVLQQNEAYFSYWISEPDNGIYQAMNKGINRVKGQYILFLNSGDWLVSDVLKNIFKREFEEDIVYFNMYLSYSSFRIEELMFPPELTMRDFYNTTIAHQATLIKAELFSKYGMYNENNKIHSDYEFWLKTIVNGNCSCKHVNEFLSYYDMGGRSSKPNEYTDIEKKVILNHYISSRILHDYEKWENEKEEMQIMYWIKSKKVLYLIAKTIYKMASNFVMLKNRFL